MKDYSSKARLSDSLNADSIVISKDSCFADAYMIDLSLDAVPNHIWLDIFEREWKPSRHFWDRKLYVIGDNLRLVTTKDDIENKLDWVKQVIERTNARATPFKYESSSWNLPRARMSQPRPRGAKYWRALSRKKAISFWKALLYLGENN